MEKLTEQDLVAQIAALESQLNQVRSDREAKTAQLERETKQRDALALISKKVEQMWILSEECAKIAEEAGVTYYYTNPDGTGGYIESGEWVSSSDNC